MTEVLPSTINKLMQRAGPAVGVCSSAGINLLGRERIRLVQLRQAMQNTVMEMERSQSKDDLVSRALLAASLTKATCDAFIEMAGALGTLAGIKGTDEFARGYGAVSAVATTATQASLGQNADWLGTANSVAKAVVKPNDVADLQFMKVDLVNSALQKDTPKLLQTAFWDYPAKIASMSLGYLGREAKKRWVDAVSGVVSSGLNYSRSLESAFDTRLDDADFAREKQRQLQETRKHITLVSQQIGEIEGIMNGCAAGLLALR